MMRLGIEEGGGQGGGEEGHQVTRVAPELSEVQCQLPHTDSIVTTGSQCLDIYYNILQLCIHINCLSIDFVFPDPVKNFLPHA